MRTYTRKRKQVAEHQEIEGVLELCRLCLKPGPSVPIFPDMTENACSALGLRIMICVGLEVTKEEGLPDKICALCHNELERISAFRKRCEVTYQKLKSHRIKVKEKAMQEAQKKKQNEVSNVVKIEQITKDSHDLLFTIIEDGSIQVSDHMNSLNGEPSVVLMTMEDLKTQLDQKTKPILVEDAPIEFLSDQGEQMQTEQLLTEQPTELQTDCLTEVISIESQGPDMDMSEFLSSMLVGFGLLTHHSNDVVTLSPKVNALEIETGDGSSIKLELVEEDEEMGVSPPQEIQRKDLQLKKNYEKNRQDAVDTNKATEKMENSRWSGKGKRRHWCQICGKGFTSRSIVARHVLNVHARQRPFSCPDCGKKFAQKAVMTRHQLVHRETRPFQCLDCPKSFTQRLSLESHARLHAPPHEHALNIYQCQKCPKVFLYASGLSRHMIYHTSKQYSCPTCDRKFKDGSSLNRHMRVMKHGPHSQRPPTPCSEDEDPIAIENNEQATDSQVEESIETDTS